MHPASEEWLRQHKRERSPFWTRIAAGWWVPVNKPCDECGVTVPEAHLCAGCGDRLVERLESMSEPIGILQSSWTEETLPEDRPERQRHHRRRRGREQQKPGRQPKKHLGQEYLTLLRQKVAANRSGKDSRSV